MALKPTTEGTVSPLPAAARSSKSSCLALACGPRRRNLRNAIWFCKVSKMNQTKKTQFSRKGEIPLRLALGLTQHQDVFVGSSFCHGQIGANLQVQELDLLRIFIKVGKRITTEFLLPQQWMEVEDSEQDVSGIGILNRILNCIQYCHDYKFQNGIHAWHISLAAKIMIPNFFLPLHIVSPMIQPITAAAAERTRLLAKTVVPLISTRGLVQQEPWGVWEVQLLDGKTQSHPAPEGTGLGRFCKEIRTWKNSNMAPMLSWRRKNIWKQLFEKSWYFCSIDIFVRFLICNVYNHVSIPTGYRSSHCLHHIEDDHHWGQTRPRRVAGA